MPRLSFCCRSVVGPIVAKARQSGVCLPRSAPCRAIGSGRLLPDPSPFLRRRLLPSLRQGLRARSASRRPVRGVVQVVQGGVHAHCARTTLPNPLRGFASCCGCPFWPATAGFLWRAGSSSATRLRPVQPVRATCAGCAVGCARCSSGAGPSLDARFCRMDRDLLQSASESAAFSPFELRSGCGA